jgi:hypothetical protein
MRSSVASSSSSSASRALCAWLERMSSSSLICTAAESRFWVFWIRNTIRKVMMVVPVLITSCQVLLNLNSGPVIAQTRTTPAASAKHNGRPVKREAALAMRVNQPSLRMS